MTMDPWDNPWHIPNWCWTLIGEDALFFSKPTATGPYTAPFAQRGCAARCTLKHGLAGETVEDLVAGRTPAIQCGALATRTPDGDWLCSSHVSLLWECDSCGAWIPEGGGGSCGHYGRTCQANEEDTWTGAQWDEVLEDFQKRIQAADEERLRSEEEQRLRHTDEDGPQPASGDALCPE